MWEISKGSWKNRSTKSNGERRRSMGRLKPLRCPECGQQPATSRIFQCPDCQTVLEVNVELSQLTRADRDMLRQSRDHSIWRWFDFLPIENRSFIVSLGEGSTPLI